MKEPTNTADRPPTTTADPRRWPGLLRIWLITFLAATVLGLFSAVVLKLGRGAAGSPISWPRAFAGTTDWFIWAFLVPAVMLIARRFPVDHQRWGAALAVHIPLGLAVALLELGLFTATNYWYNSQVLGSPYPSFADAYLATVSLWLPVAFLIYSLIVALVTAMDHSRRARDRELATARLETELVRAQVHALQAQIQPHFLFNALNTAANLVRESKRAAAVEVMATLGRLLRRTLEVSRATETTLERELEFVRDYLDLERSRMEDRLNVEFRIAPDTRDIRVPTMILQPVVENAILHGLAPLADGGTVTVATERRNGHLAVTVTDDGAGFDPRDGGAGSDGGVGLANVRSRLQAHYPVGAGLDIDSAPERGARVRIRIPCQTTEHAAGS